MTLCDLTIHELKTLMDKKKISSTDILKSVEDRIKAVGSSVSSFIHLDFESAYKKASEVDMKIINREITGSLAGIPIAVNETI
jgi:aspartyl-tRNA(Asn)/glutamyl-tRNA(Gln) amidotransferase subunit A